MIYFYDGTQNGFLTAFTAAYRDENALLSSTEQQLTLGQESTYIATDAEKAERVKARLLSFDRHCMRDLAMFLRYGCDSRDCIAFGYFKLLAREKRPVRAMLSEDAALAAEACLRRIGTELEHMRGFLRFSLTASGALYAPISPDNDICDLLAPHFRARLPHYPFVIHDVKRKKAVVYDGENTFRAPLDRADVVLSADETAWRELWKKYFESVNIPSRKRLSQQRNFLPVRYRKFMTEFDG